MILSGRHYTNWKKPRTESHVEILIVLTYKYSLKRLNLETEARMVAIRGCLGEDKEMLVTGYRVLVRLNMFRGLLCIIVTINNNVALQNGPIIDVPWQAFLQTAWQNYAVIELNRRLFVIKLFTLIQRRLRKHHNLLCGVYPFHLWGVCAVRPDSVLMRTSKTEEQVEGPVVNPSVLNSFVTGSSMPCWGSEMWKYCSPELQS